MKLFPVACVLWLICLRANASVFTGIIDPADNSTMETQLEDFTKESDGTPSNSSEPPSLEKGTVLLSSVLVDDSNSTTTMSPTSHSNRSFQHCTLDCNEERLENNLRALAIPFCCEMIMCALYFIMSDWIGIIHMKRVIISSLLMGSAPVFIFCSLASPDVDRWVLITTLIYCSFFMLYIGIGASLTDFYFSYLQASNIVTVVGSEIQIRKPLQASINACGFQIVLAALSYWIAAFIDQIVLYPCNYDKPMYTAFTKVPIVFYLVWSIFASSLLHQLEKRQTSERKPFSLQPRTYVPLLLLFVIWPIIVLMPLIEEIWFGWIPVQIALFFTGFLMALIDYWSAGRHLYNGVNVGIAHERPASIAREKGPAKLPTV